MERDDLDDRPDLEVGLPGDVKVGCTTFRKGVRLSTFIRAARRWHREAFPEGYMLTDEKKAANLATLQGVTAREHTTAADCWCGPEVEYQDPDTGAAVYVHRDVQ